MWLAVSGGYLTHDLGDGYRGRGRQETKRQRSTDGQTDKQMEVYEEHTERESERKLMSA